MPKIEINLTREELQKLAALAFARGLTIEQCIKAFARSCQPNGSGWIHPSVKAKIRDMQNTVDQCTEAFKRWAKPSKRAMKIARKRMKSSLSR
jgi:hypothetical protein